MTDQGSNVADEQTSTLGHTAFAAAVGSACIGMLLTDPHQPDNPIVFVNDAFCRLTGYAREEALGRNCRFLQGPDTDPEARAVLRTALGEQREVTVEILNYRKGGSSFWNALHISPVTGEDGELLYFFGVQMDVSGKKAGERELIERRADLQRAVEERTRELTAALEQRTLFLHELDHRVKNNLQMISSLIMLQARKTSDAGVREALNATLDRLNAVATVHRRLFQGDDPAHFDAAEFLRDLVADMLAASGRDDIELVLELEPVAVPLSKAAPLALLINELAANAIRHAYPKGHGARLIVKIVNFGDNFRIEIRDEGVGIRESGENSGFGRTIVDLLSRQLQAQVTWEDAQPGVRVCVTIPVGGI